MENQEVQTSANLLKQAKNCHTKAAWSDFCKEYHNFISSSKHSKTIGELFRILNKDPTSVNFTPQLWHSMIKGCFTSWDLELGRQIFNFAKSIHDPSFLLEGARLLLELERTQEAREQATRILRLNTATEWDHLKAQLLLANCHAEEGRNKKALALLQTIEPTILKAQVDDEEKINSVVQIGRLYYSMAQYEKAAVVYDNAAQIHQRHENWEPAARFLFNAAACYDNSRTSKNYLLADHYIKKTEEISLKQGLNGPLSYCEAFKALRYYYQGDFEEAIRCYKKAVDILPTTDQTYRRIHIISMLAFSYLMIGQWQLAQKYAQMTFDLAEQENSERLKARIDGLRAEILWEQGHVEPSLELLDREVNGLANEEIRDIDQFYLFNRQCYQNALVKRPPITHVKIDDDLLSNPRYYVEYLLPQGLHQINRGSPQEAILTFTKMLEISREHASTYFEAQALHGLILTKLSQRAPFAEFSKYYNEFKTLLEGHQRAPIEIRLGFIDASLAYNNGDFTECVKILQACQKNSRCDFAALFVTERWLETAAGYSPRLLYDWQENMLARYTKLYFAPTFSMDLKNSKYSISDHYDVELEEHELLFHLITFLLHKNGFSASMTELQEKVWKQSLRSHGWQQKIRNSIQRIRALFPYTLAPFILHRNEVKIFSDAIEIKIDSLVDKNDEDLVKLLHHNPMSALDVSERLSVSLATAKRMLKKLKDDKLINSVKDGRNVIYQSL